MNWLAAYRTHTYIHDHTVHGWVGSTYPRRKKNSTQMALFAAQAHAALLGADAILGNLDDDSDADAVLPAPPPVVINKAGSCPLALSCRFAGVPVLVVSSDLKVRKRGSRRRRRRRCRCRCQPLLRVTWGRPHRRPRIPNAF